MPILQRALFATRRYSLAGMSASHATWRYGKALCARLLGCSTGWGSQRELRQRSVCRGPAELVSGLSWASPTLAEADLHLSVPRQRHDEGAQGSVSGRGSARGCGAKEGEGMPSDHERGR